MNRSSLVSTNQRIRATMPFPAIFILLLLLMLSACSSGGGSDSDTDPLVDTGTNPDSTLKEDDRGESGPDPIPDPSGAPTSYDLIDADLQAGNLSMEQALLYKLYVQFADPALPAEYHGDDAGYAESDAPQQVVSYIAKSGTAAISAESLDAMQRFFVPPYYEGSWWHQQHLDVGLADAAGDTTAALISPAPRPNCRAWEEYCSIVDGWEYVAGTNVVIWYLHETANVDAPRANALVQSIDNTIWPKLTGLMGRKPLSDAFTGLVPELDGRLDIILVNMPKDNEGLTLPSTFAGCEAKPAHIYLNRNLSMRGLEANAAHELMHAIQFSYNVAAYCLADYYSIYEATAVWATHYVNPTDDWEHKYAKSYLRGSRMTYPYDKQLESSGLKLVRYGRYLFPLYLQNRFGDSIIKDIWDKTIDYNDELTAIDQALGAHGSSFTEEWPKFIAQSWNRDIQNTYLKLDRVKEDADLNYDDTVAMSAFPTGIGSLRHDVPLEHASAGYYRIAFGDSATRSILYLNGLSFKLEVKDVSGWGEQFLFTGLNTLQRSGISVQLLLKVKGTWQTDVIDLSNFMWMHACRDNPAGNIDEMIVIYGNGEIKKANPNYTQLAPPAGKPGLFMTNIGCRDWTGSLTMKQALTTGEEKLTISNIVLHNAVDTSAPTPTGTGSSPYPLAPGEEISPEFGYVYAVTGGTATWTYNDRDSDCTYTGSKTFSITNPFPAHTFSNWTPAGRAGRGLFLSGFVNSLSSPPLLEYQWKCSSGSGTDVSSNDLDIDVAIDDSKVRVNAATGLSLSGTQDQTNDPQNISGTWSLQGLTK